MNSKHLPLVLLALVVALSVGCGKAAYEEQMQNRISGLAFESKFIEGLHGEATEIIEGVATMRLPKSLTAEAKTLRVGAQDRIGDAIAAHRIMPFPNFPGFQYTYELFVELEGRNNFNPMYIFLGTVPAKQKSQKAVADEIARAAGRAYAGAQFQTAELDRPDGTKLQVLKMAIRATMQFDTDPSGGDAAKLPGVCDIYIVSSNDHHAIVGFRAPRAVDELVRLSEIGGLAVGTIELMESDPSE